VVASASSSDCTRPTLGSVGSPPHGRGPGAPVTAARGPVPRPPTSEARRMPDATPPPSIRCCRTARPIRDSRWRAGPPGPGTPTSQGRRGREGVLRRSTPGRQREWTSFLENTDERERRTVLRAAEGPSSRMAGRVAGPLGSSPLVGDVQRPERSKSPRYAASRRKGFTASRRGGPGE